MNKVWLVLTLLVVISACKDERKEEKMSSETEPMKERCVGRNIIKIPISFAASSVTTGVFKASGLTAQDPSMDVVVRENGLTLSQFSSEVQKRRSELEKASRDTVNVFRMAKALSDDAVLFRVQEIDDAYVSEISVLRGSSMVTVRLESYRGQFLSAEESLVKFAAGIKEKNKEITNENLIGFCLGSVIITGDFKDEKGSFLFSNGVGADYSVEIDTYTPDADIPLIQRMSGPDSLMKKFDVRHTVLRTRERSVAGMRAQEWLGWAKLTEEQDAKTFKFALDTIRPRPSKSMPSISLTFDTAQPLADGSPTKTLMSDEEAIQLWDSVVNSIRPANP